ncbi:MAG: hypothetical protein AAF125_14585 [Chloroflexota bacterium]
MWRPYNDLHGRDRACPVRPQDPTPLTKNHLGCPTAITLRVISISKSRNTPAPPNVWADAHPTPAKPCYPATIRCLTTAQLAAAPPFATIGTPLAAARGAVAAVRVPPAAVSRRRRAIRRAQPLHR